MAAPSTIIKPLSHYKLVDLSEIARFHELFYILAWRDIKVRYKQTFLGLLWVIFQPLLQTLIFTIFFGNLAHIPSGDLPYPVFALTGLIFWNFFTNTLIFSSNSLINNEAILKKVYFPRLILPLSTLITGLVDLAIMIILLFAIFVIYGISPSWQFIWVLPLAIITTSLTAAGGGIFLSALNTKYRDVRVILPFFIQTLIFVTPVIYPLTIIRPSNQLLLAINPMTGIIETVRAAVTGSLINWPILGISCLSSLILVFLGLSYFHATEKFFADII